MHCLRMRKIQEAQHGHLPVAGHQFSLSKQSASWQSMQELFSISVVQVCCKSVLGLGPVYCPKADINQLEVNANLCRASASFPIVTIKIQHINFYNVFFLLFLSFLISFLLAAFRLVMGWRMDAAELTTVPEMHGQLLDSMAQQQGLQSASRLIVVTTVVAQLGDAK